ncbi:MAG: Dabb family protein [Thiovulaceae bacterium]|nr:Dabb family protein [Sulfurimonadaceae bacterium]
MIVHIVMFQFKEEDKKNNLFKAKQMLEDLVALIDPLISMEVGIDFSQSDRAFDLSLYSTFASIEDLSTYANHPEHLKVVSFIKEVTSLSRVVDYEK